jgi:predicted transcriptional regulator
MATTIHVPGELLKRLDQRARALGTSRNRVILDAIEATLGSNGTWPPELARMLAMPPDAETSDGLETSLVVVRNRRINRKRAPKL